MLVESSKRTLESINVPGPITQKLVGEVREKYIQRWQQRTNKTTQQVIPSITHYLSIIVATSNEQVNVKPLLESLQKVFDGVCVEVIFVGDSSDMTLEAVKNAARTMNSALFQIHVELHPLGDTHNGELGTAIVNGLYKARAEHIVVVPTRFQLHVEHLRMFYDQAVAQNVDLAIAS